MLGEAWYLTVGGWTYRHKSFMEAVRHAADYWRLWGNPAKKNRPHLSRCVPKGATLFRKHENV